MSEFEPKPVEVNKIDVSVDLSSNMDAVKEIKSTARDKRLHINNLSYETTEEELQGLLKDFEVLSILIPSQTIRRFKSVQQKPLGIAYVDFKDEKQATAAQKLINGQKLHDRLLRAKPYVPYSPKNVEKSSRSRYGSRYSRKHKKDTTGPILEDQKCENKEQKESIGRTTGASEKQTGSETNTEETVVKVETVDAKPEILVSDDTVYIGHLSPKVTDGDLREFFHDYCPTDVYIFKSRLKRNSRSVFHSHHVSALVTLKETEAVTKALKTLSKKKLKGKKIDFKPAYLSKIKEVKKAAEIHAKKLEQIDQETGDSAQDAANASNFEGQEHPKITEETREIIEKNGNLSS